MMISLVTALLAIVQAPPATLPEDEWDIFALCEGSDTTPCQPQDSTVDLYEERTVQTILASETVATCRTTRTAAAQLVDETLRRLIRQANFSLLYADSTDTVVIFVAGDGDSGPVARYRLNADLSEIPIESNARQRCALRMRSVRFVRNDAGGWTASRDSFTQQVNEAIYAAARRGY